MARTIIALTKEQKETIKSVTGMDLDSLTVEKIDEQTAKTLDLNVAELEDRVNPVIEVPAPAQTKVAQPVLQAGTVYVGVTPTNTVLVQALPRV